MQRCLFLTAIVNRYLDQDVLCVILCILHKHIEIFVFIKNSRVDQFKFRFLFAAPPVFLHQPTVGIFTVWIFVKHFHIAMRWSAVEIIITLLHVFTMISFTAGQSKISLFCYWIFLI